MRIRLLSAILLVGFILTLFTACPKTISNTIVKQTVPKSNTISKNELLPQINKDDLYVEHYVYDIMYDSQKKNAKWTAYIMTKSMCSGNVERTDNFVKDPVFSCAQASNNDYKGSGYDRGHLVPAGDMTWSEQAMKESFYLTNMSPQLPGFNRGKWKELESMVRNSAEQNGSVFVITGTVFGTKYKTIGKNKVGIPDYFYKIIVDYREPSFKAIAFLMPHKQDILKSLNYTVTIDSIEKITGIDFMYAMDDSLENVLERMNNPKDWNFEKFTKKEQINKTEKKSNSVQCKGITKDGTRCKNMTTNASGYCYIHENQNEQKKERRKEPVQCSAYTKSGNRCKRMTYSPNGKCWQHGGD